MKDKIAIIGANEFQNPLILKAKEMGYETYVYAWECGDIGEKNADHFIPISIIEKERIWESCKQLGIKACVSIGSDLATHTVNYIQRRLNMPCNPEITDMVATNKYAMREALMANNIPCPKFIKVTEVPLEEEIVFFKYPLIIKPTDRSGSRGIFKVENYLDLCKSVPIACECSFEKSAIIEEYIDGEEYSCECVSFEGNHYFLAFTKKYTTGAPNFIETGHSQPSDIDEFYQEKIINQIKCALDALSIQYGASHTEFKVDKYGNAHIIEIGARMGGDCIGSDLVQYSTGFDYVRMVIDIAIGKKPNFTLTGKPFSVQIKFIFTPEDIKDYEQLENTHSDLIVKKSDFDLNFEESVSDSSTRHGYYILKKEF